MGDELSSVDDSEGGDYNFTYDMDGRMSSITETAAGGGGGYGGNPTVSFGYNSAGEVDSITDPSSNTTSVNYGTNGLVQGVNDGHGKSWSVTPEAVQGLNGLAAVGAAGSDDKVSEYTDPNGQNWTMTTDKFGNAVKTVDPLGRTTLNTYDAQGT